MSNKAIIRLILIVIFILLLAVAAVMYFKSDIIFSASKNKPADNSSSSAVDQIDEIERLSYIGVIQSLADDGFVILAKAAQNKLPQDESITVKVNSGTSYQQLGGGNNADGSAGIIALRFEDLKAGDMVLVFNAKNLSGPEIILASSIQKIIKP